MVGVYPVLTSPFVCRESKMVFDHTTSRHCADEACRGALKDSIINFGESLPPDELNNAFREGEEADLCIVLGSSLRVSPANQIPLGVHNRGKKVVICK
jgi:NAD-dependent SIR2 family protein deacetylase